MVRPRYSIIFRKQRSAAFRTGWGCGAPQPAYFIVFAIATIILLLAVPMMAIVRGYAGLSPDVPASALGPRIVHSLHAGYRVECETSGLARPVHSDNGGVVASVLPMQCGNAWSPDTAWIAPAAGAGSGDPALQLSAVPVRSTAIVALRRAGHSAHSRVLL